MNISDSGTRIEANSLPESIASGTISINSQELNLSNQATISASTFSNSAGGGSIDIQTDSLSISGGGKITSESSGSAPSGPITISTNRLNLSDGGLISADSEGTGAAGIIDIDADRINLTEGSRISSNTGGTGDAGTVDISSRTLQLVQGSQISSSTADEGDAGDINITVPISIEIDGRDSEGNSSGIIAETSENSSGAGGNIIIDPEDFTISNGGTISVRSLGQGNAGEIDLQADSLTLRNDASISATTASGIGGDINLNIRDILLLRNNSDITTNAEGIASGGNINIDAQFISSAIQEDSDIVASAVAGNGGQIQLVTEGIFGFVLGPDTSFENNIDASSDFGVDGTVEIESPQIDPTRGLEAIPSEVLNVENLIASSCGRGANLEDIGEFYAVGRKGLRLPPGENPLALDAIAYEWVIRPEGLTTTLPRSNRSQPISSHSPLIVEAQGWHRTPEGQVVLTAEPTVQQNATIAQNFSTACNS